MKKILALALAAIMMFALCACGAQATPAAPAADGAAAPAEGESVRVKMGVLNYDPTSELWLSFTSYLDYLSEYFDFEYMASEALDSAESELAFIDACAAAGCNVIYGMYNVSNEQAVLRAAEKGMYYYGQARNEAIGLNPEILANPYYLGSYDVGRADYEYGYACIKMLAEAGCHKIAGVSGGKDFGVDMFIDRWQGAMDAIADLQKEGYDIELVKEISGFPGTDGAFEAGQAEVLGMEEVDGLYSTLTALMWIKPMQDAGKFGQIKVAAAGETMGEAAIGMFGAGFYVGTATEITDIFGSVVPLAINAVNGHPVRNADGTAPLYKAGYWQVHSVEEAGFYGSVQGGDNGWAFTVEDMANLLYTNNPNVSADDFTNLYTAVTMEEILARHAG